MRFLIGLLLLNILCGCGKQIFSKKYSPDEFSVTDRAPLNLPPDYKLRAPEDKKQEKKNNKSSKLSNSEQTLINNMKEYYKTENN